MVTKIKRHFCNIFVTAQCTHDIVTESTEKLYTTVFPSYVVCPSVRPSVTFYFESNYTGKTLWSLLLGAPKQMTLNGHFTFVTMIILYILLMNSIAFIVSRTLLSLYYQVKLAWFRLVEWRQTASYTNL